MKTIILFDKESWQTRKDWWVGTKIMAKRFGENGTLVALTNIFPVLFWFRHPICAWKQRNSHLDI